MACYLFNFTRKNASKDRPLRDQAMELLHVGLWGIGARTPNRELLQPGDRVLAFVGAPEQEFVGHAVLSAGVHEWTQTERVRYPGSWTSGVAFGEADVWEHPVALQAVWYRTSAATRNPKGLFMAGVQAIKGDDFDLIVASRAAEGEKRTFPKPTRVKAPPSRTESSAPPASATASSASLLAERLYREGERLKAYLAAAVSQPTTEAATRALFINKQLEALGYDQFGDVDFDAPVDSGDFADYVLKSSGKRIAVVEAKKLGAVLGAKEAAQVVKYASVLGVRWGILTDGRKIRLYDPRVPDVTPENRLVFEIDLAGFADREDFLVRLYPELELLSKEKIADEGGLERRTARGAAWELLTTAASATVEALRGELAKKKLVQMSREQVAELLEEMLG